MRKLLTPEERIEHRRASYKKFKSTEKYRESYRKKYAENPEKYRAKTKAYRLKYPEKVKEYRKKHNTLEYRKQQAEYTKKVRKFAIDEQKRTLSERNRKCHLKRLYGLTPEKYDELMLRQSGLCAICKKKKAGGRWKTDVLYVDHDHTTGKVRGLLCYSCNTAIGLIKDNVEIAKEIINYLSSN